MVTIAARNIKKKENSGKEAEKNKGGAFLFNLLIIFVVILCIVFTGGNYAKIVRKSESLEAVKKEHNSVRIKKETLQDRLDKSRLTDKTLDEDYIIGVAKEHGLRKDSDIIFYLYPEE